MYKRIVTLAEISGSQTSRQHSSLNVLNHFIQSEKRYFKSIAVQSLIIVNGNQVLQISEGKPLNVVAAQKRTQIAGLLSKTVTVINTFSPEKILGSSLRLIPEGSSTHHLVLQKLRAADSAALSIETHEHEQAWRLFADWGNVNVCRPSTYKNHQLMLADWPHKDDLRLSDDDIVVCAIMMGKPTRYEEIAARNIVPRGSLEQLLASLSDLGLLQVTQPLTVHDNNTQRRSSHLPMFKAG